MTFRAPTDLTVNCPICGSRIQVSIAGLAGEARCSACGVPLWVIKMHDEGWACELSKVDRVTRSRFEERIAEADSVEFVELVMELESLE